ncbi:DNA-binding IclR family transcriptional regulator [Spinactinospora alkalitolerans]|uniref:DNA-binding IclR family transcriptional regulator n=1 Tax=Spinactinospora alkalitolerans TaxID=687207 RepID=A0A852TWK2_9ACTN|nr:DNA-binding IclR family transcriptional regulator [Spinactinospora alkalitolerans]
MLNTLAEHPAGLTLATLTENLGMPKPTVHRLVSALSDAELTRLDAESGRYRIARGALTLASAFLEGIDVREACLPALRDLSESCGETCHLGIREDLRIIYIEKREAKWPVRMYSRIGNSNPLHCTGIGKAVLAWSADSLVAEVVRAGLHPRTPATIIDPAALRAELAAIRERGWAVDDVENEVSIRCVAAPVFDWEGNPVAAFSVAGPEFRMTDDALARFGPLVRHAGLAASQKLGWRPQR